MQIKLKYGSYSHALQEASVVITRQTMTADNGVPYAVFVRWDIEGTLIAATQGDLSTAINSLVAAYSQHGQDAQLLFDDNSQTSHTILTANTWGGVRVSRPPYFPQGDGAEYTLYRNYNITIEAEERISTTGANILSWEETVEVQGTGGPRRAVIEVLNGYPQEQITTTNTVVQARQRGSSKGLNFYAPIPPPLWPDAEQVAERTITNRNPRAIGTGSARTYREYERSWSYTFVSAVPLVGGTPVLQPDL